MWNSSTCECECNKACKIDEYLDIKNCSLEKHLISKLVLEFEDEVLNPTETSLDHKKVTYEKNNCLIYKILLDLQDDMLVIIISCCFYWLLSLLNKGLD